MTPYVDDITGWQDWQRAYRYGALLLVPPEPLLSAVNALRAPHDPWSAAICEAHVSLTVPLPRAMTASNWRELASIAGAFESFPVTYGPPISFPPHPGVCLAIEPRDTIRRLVDALEGAAAFGGASPRPYPFTPHMTIAERLTPEQTQPLLDELADTAPTGVFDCTEVWLSVPDGSFRFTRRERLRLAASDSDALG